MITLKDIIALLNNNLCSMCINIYGNNYCDLIPYNIVIKNIEIFNACKVLSIRPIDDRILDVVLTESYRELLNKVGERA